MFKLWSATVYYLNGSLISSLAEAMMKLPATVVLQLWQTLSADILSYLPGVTKGKLLPWLQISGLEGYGYTLCYSANAA